MRRCAHAPGAKNSPREGSLVGCTGASQVTWTEDAGARGPRTLRRDMSLTGATPGRVHALHPGAIRMNSAQLSWKVEKRDRSSISPERALKCHSAGRAVLFVVSKTRFCSGVK